MKQNPKLNKTSFLILTLWKFWQFPYFFKVNWELEALSFKNWLWAWPERKWNFFFFFLLKIDSPDLWYVSTTNMLIVYSRTFTLWAVLSCVYCLCYTWAIYRSSVYVQIFGSQRSTCQCSLLSGRKWIMSLTLKLHYVQYCKNLFLSSKTNRQILWKLKHGINRINMIWINHGHKVRRKLWDCFPWLKVTNQTY